MPHVHLVSTSESMPIWGLGSDRWGRRRTYLVGIVVFTVGSALCVVSRTRDIAARAVEGVGAGAVATLPFVLLGVVYPPEKRGWVLPARRGRSAGRRRIAGTQPASTVTRLKNAPM